jgi:hypothetical protein
VAGDEKARRFWVSGLTVNQRGVLVFVFEIMAARAGFEPATKWLTATCSTTELPSNLSSGKLVNKVGGMGVVNRVLGKKSREREKSSNWDDLGGIGVKQCPLLVLVIVKVGEVIWSGGEPSDIGIPEEEAAVGI